MCLKWTLPQTVFLQAAWGGGLLMSSTHKAGKFSGVERADSLTWNPHKLLGVLLQCSTLHLKEKGILADCNTMKARYLFQQDKHYDVSYDTGDKVIQCGRHNDIFKFWLAWRGKGTAGFELQMDRIMELTQYQAEWGTTIDSHSKTVSITTGLDDNLADTSSLICHKDTPSGTKWP